MAEPPTNMTNQVLSAHSGSGRIAPQTTNSNTDADLFAVLSNQRRVYTLRYLEFVGGEAPLSELAEAVAELEYQKPIHDITNREKNNIRVSLSQRHIPRLKDENMVDYESKRDGIWLSDRSGEALAHLRESSLLERAWEWLCR